MIGRGWLGKRVNVYAGYDSGKQHSPIAAGKVIAYIDGPSIIVRDAEGNDQAWPVTLPIEVTPRAMTDCLNRPAPYCGWTIPDGSCPARPGGWHLCVGRPDHEQGATQNHVCECGHAWTTEGNR